MIYGESPITKTNSAAEVLCDEIRSVFRKSSPVLGNFSKEDGTEGQLSQLLNRLREDSSQSSFVDFSRNAVEALRERMKVTPMATGGLVIFVEYEHDERRFLMVALVSETHVPWFDEKMKLRENEAIDLKKLRHGVRIDMGELDDTTANCVAVLSSKGRESARYFDEFVDFVKREDPAAIASKLYHRIEAFAKLHSVEPEKVSAMHEHVYSYWRERRKEGVPVSIEGFGNAAMPDDPGPLIEFLSAEDSGIPGEFQPPPDSAMRRFTRFSETEDGLTLSFAKGRWAQSVKWDESGGRRRIIIEAAPERMFERLKEEFTELG